MQFRKRKETGANIWLLQQIWEGIFSSPNTLGEIKTTIKGEITKVFVDTEATLSVLNLTQIN